MKMKISFVFFGTSEFSVIILQTLKESGLIPCLIITREDKPKGRKLVLTAPPVKICALENKVETLQPEKLDTDFVNYLNSKKYDLFIVASFGKILPKKILDIPRHLTLNVHPSLLPKLRGPSPIQGAILNEDHTGVTIMRLDEQMDHGPIVKQKKVISWATPNSRVEHAPSSVKRLESPPYYLDLEKLLAREGGKLLAQIIPDWISGKIEEVPQEHRQATYIKKIEKRDGQIDLSKNPEINLRKIRAYSGSINAFTFFKRNGKDIRVSIKKARLENNSLILERVIPEGKKEMDFEDFKRGFLT